MPNRHASVRPPPCHPLLALALAHLDFFMPLTQPRSLAAGARCARPEFTLAYAQGGSCGDCRGIGNLATSQRKYEARAPVIRRTSSSLQWTSPTPILSLILAILFDPPFPPLCVCVSLVDLFDETKPVLVLLSPQKASQSTKRPNVNLPTSQALPLDDSSPPARIRYLDDLSHIETYPRSRIPSHIAFDLASGIS